jgi:hypothetical protein
MVLAASKYGAVRTSGRPGVRPPAPPAGPSRRPDRPAGGLNLLLPARRRDGTLPAFVERELRSGGLLQRYLEQERAATEARYRAVARQTAGFQQNHRSDLRVLAHVPARDYFRWLATDPHFWQDDQNLRSLRRDNPHVKVYL